MNWEGNEQLRPFLVALTDLKADRGNPRKGDVTVIADSLRRFGQQRPVLATSAGRMVAGSHTVAAARALDWTHVAVVRTALRGREQKAYGLADNRTGDLGVYDDGGLADLLERLPSLDGTGYTQEDAELYRALASLGDYTAPTADDEAATPYRIALRYERDDYDRVIAGFDRLMDAHDLDTFSDAARKLVLG